METLRLIVLMVHLVGFGLLFGAWATQAFGGKREVTRLMHIGLAIAGAAGVVLAAPWGLGDRELDYVKIGVKLVILLVIGGLMGAVSARTRKSGAAPVGLFWAVGILTLVNVGIALLWR